MKKNCLCVALSIICAFSLLTILTSAAETKENRVITTIDNFDNIGGGSYSYETIKGESCIMVTGGEGEWPTVGLNNLNIKVSDYKFIVIKCYYTGNIAFNRAPVIQVKKIEAGTLPWTTLKGKDGSMGFLDTFFILPDTWQTAIFPIESDDFSNITKYPNGKDDIIQTIQLYMFSNGGVKKVDMSTEDKVYIKSITFTNSYKDLIDSDEGSSTTTSSTTTSSKSTTDSGTSSSNTTSSGRITSSVNTTSPGNTTGLSTTTSSDSKGSDGISTGMIAGIVIGVIVISGAAYMIFKRKK